MVLGNDSSRSVPTAQKGQGGEQFPSIKGREKLTEQPTYPSRLTQPFVRHRRLDRSAADYFA